MGVYGSMLSFFLGLGELQSTLEGSAGQGPPPGEELPKGAGQVALRGVCILTFLMEASVG